MTWEDVTNSQVIDFMAVHPSTNQPRRVVYGFYPWFLSIDYLNECIEWLFVFISDQCLKATKILNIIKGKVIPTPSESIRCADKVRILTKRTTRIWRKSQIKIFLPSSEGLIVCNIIIIEILCGGIYIIYCSSDEYTNKMSLCVSSSLDTAKKTKKPNV